MKKAGAKPALSILGIEPYAETLARSVHTPGGWGAEESGARSGSGPEATIHYFAIQLGACLAEMGLHCESLNESVIPPVKNAAPRRLRRENLANSAVVLGRARLLP